MDMTNFSAVLLFLGAFSPCLSSENKTATDVRVDVIKTVALLSQAALLEATENLPMFKCLTADLTALDVAAGTLTYTWHVIGRDGKAGSDIVIDYQITEEGPDMALAYVNSDTSNPIPAQALYSDSKTCMIYKIFWGHQEICFHWQSKETITAPPEDCITAFREKCGSGVRVYKDDFCK